LNEGRSRWVDAGFRPAYGGQAPADKSAKRIGGKALMIGGNGETIVFLVLFVGFWG
jgi:hypothetical protein